VRGIQVGLDVGAGPDDDLVSALVIGTASSAFWMVVNAFAQDEPSELSPVFET